jgi:hypothetical protein
MRKGVALGQVFGATDFTHLERLHQLGAQVVRIDFRPVSGLLAWTPGALLGLYASLLEKYTRAGMEIVGVLGPALIPGDQAHWDSPIPVTAEGYRWAWLAAARAVVQAFPWVLAWEIWNEPNAFTTMPPRGIPSGGTYMSPANYAGLLDAAYRALAPLGARILGGSLFAHDIKGQQDSASTGLYYWAAVLETQHRHRPDLRIPCDGLAYHPYLARGGALPAGRLTRYLETIVPLGRGIPTWITEAGWSTVCGVDPTTQASNITTLLHEAQSALVETCLIYTLADEPRAGLAFGLCDQALDPKPAFAAFAAA